MKLKKPFILFIYGLPCSGKTTIAKHLKDYLTGNVVHIDGDDIRKNSNK